MRVYLFIIMLFLTYSLTLSQTIEYDYDDSGNRVLRMISPGSESNQSIQEKSTAKSFQDEINNHDIFIYPNPFKNQITIQIENMSGNIEGKILVYDPNGKLVLSENKLENSNILDLSSLPPGNYFVTIHLGTENKKWTIVKE